LPLVGMLDRRLAVDVGLFSRGGMRILDKIESQGYDVFSRRPAISRSERAWLLLTTVARVALSRTA
jgi:phytoene/squalene synthetase